MPSRTIATVGVTGSYLKCYRVGRARLVEDEMAQVGSAQVEKVHVGGLVVDPTLLDPDKADFGLNQTRRFRGAGRQRHLYAPLHASAARASGHPIL